MAPIHRATCVLNINAHLHSFFLTQYSCYMRLEKIEAISCELRFSSLEISLNELNMRAQTWKMLFSIRLDTFNHIMHQVSGRASTVFVAKIFSSRLQNWTTTQYG